jgi:hypothetical protein
MREAGRANTLPAPFATRWAYGIMEYVKTYRHDSTMTVGR